MDLKHNRCLFKDKQMVRLQENPEDIPQVLLDILLLVFLVGAYETALQAMLSRLATPCCHVHSNYPPHHQTE